jgi:hypothetical protein
VSNGLDGLGTPAPGRSWRVAKLNQALFADAFGENKMSAGTP